MSLLIRTLLELLVMVSLVAGAIKLHDDWKIIEPPSWRFVIAGFLLVVAANAAALLWAITEHRPLTWATWTLAASYTALLTSLVGARLHYKLMRALS